MNCIYVYEQASEMREYYETMSKEVTTLNSEIAKCDKEIKQLEKVKSQCLKVIQEDTLECRKLQHKLKQWEKDSKDAIKIVSSMIKQYAWIETEKQHFGVIGGDYDFTAYGDMKTTRQKLQSLKVDQERLAKKINKKVMGMIEKAEAEAEELTRKKQVSGFSFVLCLLHAIVYLFSYLQCGYLLSYDIGGIK